MTITISAVLIVRNEAEIVGDAVKALLATGVISEVFVCDTGSDDDTVALAREAGARVETDEWIDFGTNRTRALHWAMLVGSSDYYLMIDVDDRLEVTLPGEPDAPGRPDGMTLPVDYDGVSMQRTHLFRSGVPWRYRGAVHEYPQGPEGATVAPFHGLRYLCNVTDSARDRDPEKYKKDALLCEAEFARSSDPRPAFYAGRSWHDYAKGLAAGEERTAALTTAAGWLKARSEMKADHEEEGWYAALDYARVLEALGEDPEGAYLAAYNRRPWRCEPLYSLASHLRRKGRPHAALMVAGALFDCANLPDSSRENDRLFVESWANGWGAWDEIALAYHQTGDHTAAIRAAEHMLDHAADLPEHARAQVQVNLHWFRKGLAK